MTIRWKDGKVDRSVWLSPDASLVRTLDERIALADALDEAVAALRAVATREIWQGQNLTGTAVEALRRLGVE